MKKYITPAAKYINIASEGHLLQGSNTDPEDGLHEKTTSGTSLSNRRNIWGEEY